MTSVTLTNIEKQFNRRIIFRDVSFRAIEGQVFAITGKNGSGKSTLLKIMAGVLAPTKGKVAWQANGSEVLADRAYQAIGYCAPYVQMFEEFSAVENIQFFARVRNQKISVNEIHSLLTRIGLPLDRKDPMKSFSSGMKQRMKLIFAIMNKPSILFLDEPTTNLDEEGIAAVRSIMKECREDTCVVVATNHRSDLELCDEVLDLNLQTQGIRGISEAVS